MKTITEKVLTSTLTDTTTKADAIKILNGVSIIYQINELLENLTIKELETINRQIRKIIINKYDILEYELQLKK